MKSLVIPTESGYAPPDLPAAYVDEAFKLRPFRIRFSFRKTVYAILGRIATPFFIFYRTFIFAGPRFSFGLLPLVF